MELSVTLSVLKNGIVKDSTRLVKTPEVVTEKCLMKYVKEQVSSIGFERYISLSWRPA
jgi:hypothetical protein